MKLTSPGGGPVMLAVSGLSLPPGDGLRAVATHGSPTSVGGGPPVITANGVTLSPEDDFRPGAAGSLVLDLSIDQRAATRGQRVLELIRDAVRRCSREGGTPSGEAIRELGRLVDVFPEIALRMPELLDYICWLEAHGFGRAIARVLGESVRGRRRESYFYLVELLDRIKERESCSIATAAHIAEKQFGRELSMTALSLQNNYSRFKELYSVAKGSQYVRGADLAP